MQQKSRLFATKDSTEEALEYAVELGKAEGMPEGYMTIAILLYHNTLIEQVIKLITGETPNDKG